MTNCKCGCSQFLYKTENGKLCKSKKIIQCDGAYCKLAFEHMKALIEQKKTEIVNLEKLIALYY